MSSEINKIACGNSASMASRRTISWVCNEREGNSLERFLFIHPKTLIWHTVVFSVDGRDGGGKALHGVKGRAHTEAP
jgi:hypothetical protein